MNKHWCNLTACLLAALLLAGCMPSNMGQASPSGETAAPPATDPTDGTTGLTDETTPVETLPKGEGSLIATDPAGSSKGIALEAVQQRLREKQSGWGRQFPRENGYALLVSDAAELADKLRECGIGSDEVELSGFDGDYFQKNRLLVIPMASNSGSVRYSALAKVEGNAVTVTLEATIDGIGTADMADWLVFVTLPRGDFGEDAVIQAAGNENMFGAVDDTIS